MTRVLKRVSPFSAGKIFGAMYFSMSVVFIPFFAVPIFLSPSPTPFPFGMVFLIGMPFLYGALGFVMTCIGAWIYNFFAAHLGGLEFEVSEANEQRAT